MKAKIRRIKSIQSSALAKEAKFAKQGSLLLDALHLKDLKKSGLSDEQIQKAGIKTVSVERLKEILKFQPRGVQSAYQIPYKYKPDFCRLRIFPEIKDDKGRKRKYLQPLESSPQFYFPPSFYEGILKDASCPLFVIEGEKKVLAAEQNGIKNSIAIAGIWSWRKDEMPLFDFEMVDWQGRIVYFVPDSDVWQRDDLLFACYAFCKEIENRGAEVLVTILPNGRNSEKCGLDDFLLTHSISEFYTLEKIKLSDERFCVASEDYEKWRKKHLSQISLFSQSKHSKRWPKALAQSALYGLAGEYVRFIDPVTESDLAAILIQFLVAFGNVIGRTAHFTVGRTQHFLNMFAVLVGDTSKGRKGTAWDEVKRIFQFDDEWYPEHIRSGLSSGEGFIYAVRDAVYQEQPVKKNGKLVGYENVRIDPGIKDKRLLVVETEFASTLRVLEREGNTLSPQLRAAWDASEKLRTMTRNSPITATNPHISLIGHITSTELRRYLRRTEVASGLGNRFLWLCVKRSKSLPEAGKLNIPALTKLIDRLEDAVKFAKSINEINRDEEARRYWIAIYDDLSEGKPGLYGALLNRAEAQVMRLAAIYALLDKSRFIKKFHLEAALSLWRYAEQSVLYVFGESLGDPIAETILNALRHYYPQGLALSQISELFHRHGDTAAIHNALEYLRSINLAICTVIETPGRAAQVWKAVMEEPRQNSSEVSHAI